MHSPVCDDADDVWERMPMCADRPCVRVSGLGGQPQCGGAWAWARRTLRRLGTALGGFVGWEGKSRWRRGVALATAPVALAMHATNPSLHLDSYGCGYAGVLAAAAPGFLLQALGWGPRAIPPAACATAWACLSAALAAALGWRLCAPGGGGGGGGGGCARRAPRRSLAIAGVSLAMSAVWLQAVACEVVALLQAGGRALGVASDVLGATVLAWGENVPKVVATLTLARAGQGTMALAACFAGPVFNLAVGLGGPVLLQGAKTGAAGLPVRLTNGVLLLGAQSVRPLFARLLSTRCSQDRQRHSLQGTTSPDCICAISRTRAHLTCVLVKIWLV